MQNNDYICREAPEAEITTMTDHSVATRLKFFIDEKGLTSTRFADLCKIPRPSISQLLNGRNKKISDILVGQIHSAFPELSVVWLLFGEGDMIKPDVQQGSTAPSEGRENGLFDEIDDAGDEYGNDSGIMGALNSPYGAYIQSIGAKKEVPRQRLGKNEAPKVEKKISHITVYYDDSTFETFYPR